MFKIVEERRNDLMGRDFVTNSDGNCFVIDYKGNKEVTVMFYDPIAVVKCRLDSLLKGGVKNPYSPTVYGVGYTGVGKYGWKDRAYNVWKGIMERGYNTDYKEKFPSCADVSVYKGWHNFQNFAEWFYEQKFHKERDQKGRVYELDKDILVKGNKIYSPETCCFVPPEINILLVNKEKSRGINPIGVCKHQSGRFAARISKYGKPVCLGYFKTPEQAFNAYKVAKESHIKFIANLWKGKIDDKVYQALLEWKIEITD